MDMSKTMEGHLIAARKVTGTAVYSTQGQKLGSIEDIVFDKQSGTVEYAVLSFGGIFGLGDKHYPLPWSALEYDTRYDGYVVNLDKDQLRDAPAYGPQEPIDWTRDYGRRIESFYKIPGIWQ
jgi:sporulation protein YlmC with PRC-barrel domain